ncbi:hypothetical protein BG000_001466 [Podila horticola]|nr:hypothetical protein BG000_001466 [Podila horticola]
MNTPGHSQGLNGHDASSHMSTPGQAADTATPGEGPSGSSSPPVPHIRIVPHLDAPRSLHFDVVDKDVPEGFVLKIGRFTDKQALPNRVTFKSKVVSRGHAEIYTENGKFYIRDTKSSSGTFLNHARLSPPGVESKPTQLKDGDVVQLGVDYQGGTQEIYRCVKMRLELNRSWQQQANPFRMNTLKVIRSLTTATAASATDCCICLFRIASFQSLFVAPCSHVYHYKCIRPLLIANHPGFLCPLCRTFADLEDSVEIDDPIEEDVPAEAVAAIEAPNGQANAVENVQEPEIISRPTRTEAVASPMEEAYAPTPPSEQAHTFQPPEPYPINNPVIQSMAVDEPAPSPQEQEQVDAHSGAVENHVENGANEGATLHLNTMPVDIAHFPPSSIGTAAQPSPSSAFFMAPSPPPFVSGSGGPIPFSSPSRNSASQNPSSVSPSNHMAAAGHMIQNFVRNISIPSRNRTRTNSNSPLNPMVQGGSSAPGVPAPVFSLLVPGSGHGDLHSDVFGKTLVVTPPPMVSNGEGTGGASELAPVSEMDVEPMAGGQGAQPGSAPHSTEPSQDSEAHPSQGRLEAESGQSPLHEVEHEVPHPPPHHSTETPVS